MPGIETWLAQIGLDRYLAVFQDAEIDVDTLPELTDDDLRELGLPLGPRRKIAKAIADIAASKDNPAAPQNGRRDGVHAGQEPHAERRHLTVMFVDLVGSTEMATRLDAEDMRDAITVYQNAVASEVRAFDGFVAKFMGDGVLCYFGWPHANEDDTERAVRAGLSIIKTVSGLTAPDGAALAARVGVANGIVIVGDLIGSAASQEAAVVGETPNLAARLQDIASPNQLVVPGDALALLGSTFELAPLGAQTLKGVHQPVEAFVVEGEIQVESRFAARRAGLLTPIVGRDSELDQIRTCWSRAQMGQGQMVLVDGEAGIGKSRVIRAAIDAVAHDAPAHVTYQCSPNHSESAFYPFIRRMGFAADFAAHDTSEQRLDKMEATLGSDRATNALLAQLLNLDGVARYGAVEGAPERQRARLMGALVDLLVRQANDGPLLIVFEDLHWIDPTSLELLDAIIAALPGQKMMILATTRPTFDHDFGAAAPLTRLTLKRLGRDMTYAIVAKLTGGKVMPDKIMKIIARRTDGVPLFVEELTKTILESGVLSADGDGFLLNGSLDDVTIPVTLHDSLMARLDRLGQVKEIAQIAACIGREFSHALIMQICDLEEDKLHQALNQLSAAELIHRRGVPPRARYIFKHALVRDAAYESVLKERRAQFHTRILTALETNNGTPPELLAGHAEAARLTDRAIDLWEDAGKAAISRPAYLEAEAHLRRAIALNDPKTKSGQQDALERALALKVQLFVALSPGKGLWANETVETLEEALALADKVGDTPLRGDIIYGLLLSTYFRGSLERSIARADELNGLADASGDLAQLLVAKRLAAIGRLKMGLFTQAQPYLDEAEALCAKVADQDLAARFGHDPVVAVKIYQSLSATFRGQTALAGTYHTQAEDRASEIAHTNTSCAMLGIAVVCAHVADDLRAEKRHMRILRMMIEEHAVTASRLWADATFALLKMAEGDVTGIEAYRDAEATLIAANIRLLVPGNRVVAARRAFALGLAEDAFEMADAAEAMMLETGEKSWLPEVYRLRAEFANKYGDGDLAEQHLRQAIDISSKDGGLLWEVRAALDLAELYQRQSRTAKAVETLQPVVDKIAQGDCLREAARAKEMFDALKSA